MVAYENKGAMAATVVVAASDSLNKAAANYVCDGVADDVEIQAAINALPAGGGKVVLLEGTYNIVTNILPNSYNELCGQGNGTKLVAQTDTMWVIRIANKQGVTVRDLWVDHNNLANTGVRFDTATCVDGKVISVKFSNSPSGVTTLGIGAQNAEDILIQNCTFDTMANYAVATNFVSRVKVEGCHSYNGMGEIAINDAFDSVIIGNTVECTLDDSIAYKLITSERCTIVGNVAKSTSKVNSAGIALGTSKHCAVSNNIVSGFLSGIVLNTHSSYDLVANNEIYDCTTGIWEYTAAEYAAYIGNHIAGCTTGADVAMYRGVFNDNNIVECTIGLYIDTLSRDSSIIGNHFEAIQQEAIKFMDTTGISDLTIVGNSIGDAGIETNNTYAAILLGGTGHILIGNEIRSLAANKISYGIQEQSTCDYNKIIDNNIVASQTAPILIIGTHDATDIMAHAVVSLDLSGAATDLTGFHANYDCQLLGYTILYTEASSADAGVDVRIGCYGSGVALDDDYFDLVTSEVSKALGYAKTYVSADLTNALLPAGYTITVGTAGGKVGTGEVMIILHIAEMAS